MLKAKQLPVLIGILLLSGMFLMGQDTWPPDTYVSVSILVQVDPLYPAECNGLTASDPVANAEIQVTYSGDIVASGYTNPDGVLVVELLSSKPYSVDVVAETPDPDCSWKSISSSSFYVGTDPRDVSVDVWPIGPSCPTPPVEVSILVQIDPSFPEEFDGLSGGDPVPNAEVEITNRYSGELVISGTTDLNGELLVGIPGISRYFFYAAAPTSDPYCFWSGSADVVVGTDPLGTTVDLWLVCE